MDYDKKYYLQQIIIGVLGFLSLVLAVNFAYAQNTECAEVKIVIEQKLSFERQAFDAKMIISNGLTSSDIKDVKIELSFLDANHQSVIATTDPNATNAKFFYRIDTLTGINSIIGDGQIAAKSSAEIHWLIIPSAGAVEFDDVLYYVGAKVTYTLNDMTTTVDVTPDYIVVRPLPMLTLDYFFPKDVYADDPFTPEIEPPTPFTLGVRIKNTGYGAAYNTAIESAQPRITENKQNLLIGFEISGGFVADQPAGKSLKLNFGDITPHSSAVGRWQMITTLSGKFRDFNASYTHADTLGGVLTSLIKEIKTHTLVHDVKVSGEYVLGRDNIRDFLAKDEDTLRVYESDGIDTKVEDVSAKSRLEFNNGKVKIYRPITAEFSYLKLSDPHKGKLELIGAYGFIPNTISLPFENIWLSKERNEDLSWSYYINVFDIGYGVDGYDLIFSKSSKGDISGVVFNDHNNNGMFDQNELGIGLVPVTLKGIDDNGANISISAHTDKNGLFKFTQLGQGNYSIEVSAINGMTDGIAMPGAIGGVSAKGIITNIKLNAGMNAEGNTFAKLDSEAKAPAIGSADLSVVILTPMLSHEPKLGEIFSLFVAIGNVGPDTAVDSVLEFKLPKNLSLIDISSGHTIDQSGKVNFGSIIKQGEWDSPVFVIFDVKVNDVGDGQIPLVARVSSPTPDPDLKHNVFTTSITIDTTHK